MSTKARKTIAADLRQQLTRERAQRLFYAMYPDQPTTWLGPTNMHFDTGQHIYQRDLYPIHLEFFEAGAKYPERCFMAANRVSKTLGGGGYEMAVHLTGLYPHWWTGRRFNAPIRAWAAGKTNETTRDIVSGTLLGGVKYKGTRKFVDGGGVIPGALLGELGWKQGVSNLIDTIKVKHASGGWSELGLKAYHQGRGAFEGTAKHAIWLDEEPPADVYDECLMRTTTTNGIIMLTFTPLDGLSDVTEMFMPSNAGI